jgi:transcriptional regulator with XRE-family HTH domain
MLFMARTKSILLSAPPYEVERGLARLGQNLRAARLLRNLTIEEVARKIGTGTRSVMQAERGHPGTAMAVYAALLWVYGLLEPLTELADLQRDPVGRAAAERRQRARKSVDRTLSDDF